MRYLCFFFFSSRRRHTRWNCDWSSDVCSSDLVVDGAGGVAAENLLLLLRDRRDEDDRDVAGALALLDQPSRLEAVELGHLQDRKSTRLNSSHSSISYAVFCLKKKTHTSRCSHA